MSRVLAFDFGASTGRAILAEYKNGKLSYNEVHRFDNNLVEKDGLLCWDFDYLLNEVKKAIDMCENVDSLAFDTWGVDYGMLDKDGKLISLPVCYRDDRTKNEVSKVFEKMPDKKLYSLTGNQIMAINTLFQLCSEKINNADTFIFMPDLFAYFLCGAKTAEQTIASTSQMLDLENVKWQKEVFNLTGKSESILPPIVKSATQAGEYKGIKVIKVAGHDTQCAVCAMPANPDKTPAFLSCGTWSLIGCENDEPILTEKSMNDELSNELGANGKINYLKNISGLWLIQEIRRNFKSEGKEYSYNDMEQLARGAKAFEFFIDPDDASFAAPGNMPEENTGKKFDVLHLLGGGTKDGFLCQMTADSLNMDVIAGPTEATALGNIVLQLIALGDIKNVDEGREIIKSSEKLTTYKSENAGVFASNYNRFVKILNK